MAKNSRRKGANYERKIAKILSKWSGMELRRTPLSGGWSHGNPDTAGDLVNVSPDKEFPIHVECKDNSAWNFDQIMKGKGNVVGSWWQQTTDECPAHKFPALFFSKAYKQDYVMFIPREAWLARLETVNYVKVGNWRIITLADFINLFTIADFISVEAIHGSQESHL